MWDLEVPEAITFFSLKSCPFLDCLSSSAFSSLYLLVIISCLLLPFLPLLEDQVPLPGLYSPCFLTLFLGELWKHCYLTFAEDSHFSALSTFPSELQQCKLKKASLLGNGDTFSWLGRYLYIILFFPPDFWYELPQFISIFLLATLKVYKDKFFKCKHTHLYYPVFTVRPDAIRHSLMLHNKC